MQLMIVSLEMNVFEYDPLEYHVTRAFFVEKILDHFRIFFLS